jgi:hypothetical protein
MKLRLNDSCDSDHVASFNVNANHSIMCTAGSALKRPGVEPVFLNQRDAIDYATGRACLRSGEIRVLDSSGGVERIIPFNETNRRL